MAKDICRRLGQEKSCQPAIPRQSVRLASLFEHTDTISAFDAETLATEDVRVLYTLATLDDLYVLYPSFSCITDPLSVRTNPDQIITGYLSMVIMDLNICQLHLRNMAMCTEWYLISSSHSDHLERTRSQG